MDTKKAPGAFQISMKVLRKGKKDFVSVSDVYTF